LVTIEASDYSSVQTVSMYSAVNPILITLYF